jgi:hypothetical protein
VYCCFKLACDVTDFEADCVTTSDFAEIDLHLVKPITATLMPSFGEQTSPAMLKPTVRAQFVLAMLKLTFLSTADCRHADTMGRQVVLQEIVSAWL